MTADHLEQIRCRNMDAGGFGPRIMMGLKVCPRCGSAERASRWFCRECGCRLPHRTLYQQYKEIHRCCPNCDTVLPHGAHYCAQCGQSLPPIK